MSEQQQAPEATVFYRFRKNVINPINLTNRMGLEPKMIQTQPQEGHMFTLSSEDFARYAEDLRLLTDRGTITFVQ